MLAKGLIAISSAQVDRIFQARLAMERGLCLLLSIDQRKDAMLSNEKRAAIRAVLLYWCDEMVPQGRAIMRPYFKAIGVERATAS